MSGQVPIDYLVAHQVPTEKSDNVTRPGQLERINRGLRRFHGFFIHHEDAKNHEAKIKHRQLNWTRILLINTAKLDRINGDKHGFLLTMDKNNIEDPDPSGINSQLQQPQRTKERSKGQRQKPENSENNH